MRGLKIGTGIRTIPAGCLTDSITVERWRWPVRGSAWSDKREAGVLGQTVKESGTGGTLSREGEEEQNRGGI